MPAAAAALARRHLETIGLLGIYALLFAAWNLSGGAFRVWPDLWQLLPWPPLLDDLWGSLLDLHAQPPGLNLLFGLALRASARFRVSVEALLQPAWFAAGAVSLAALSALAGRLLRPWPRRVVLLLVVLNPYLYAALHQLFYTALEVLFLGLGAILAAWWLERPGPGRLAAALAPAVLLVLTRSLFHPLWFVLLLALLLALGRAAGAPRGRLAAVAAAALLLVAAWPLKNLVRFGFFGTSSWSGLSLARGLPTGEPLLPSGYPARLAAFARNGPLDPAAAAAARALVPVRFVDRPTLAILEKPDGSPNWNHHAILPLSRDLGAAARERLLRDPGVLPLKAIDFYLNGYAIYEARWPYGRGLAPEATAAPGWFAVYEAIVFQPFRAYDPSRTRASTGFALVVPVVLAAALVRLWRRRGRWGTGERTIAVLLFSVLWVLALVLLVDGPEGNRVRFSTEPYLFVVAGWLVGGRPDPREPAAPSPA
jgi:hypothetical protein